MDYPQKFSAQARAAVEAELITVQRAHTDRKKSWDSQWSFPERESLTMCITTVFLRFAQQAIALGRAQCWTADEVRKQALRGLRLLTIEISNKFGYSSFIESYGGGLTREALREFEATEQWRRFEDEFYSFASQQARLSATEQKLVALPRIPTGTGNPLLDELAAAQAAALDDLPSKPLSEPADKALAAIQQKIQQTLSPEAQAGTLAANAAGRQEAAAKPTPSDAEFPNPANNNPKREQPNSIFDHWAGGSRAQQSEIYLNQAQKQKFREAEQKLRDNLEAHEKMRELAAPTEWRRAGTSPARGPIMIGEIQKLVGDVQNYCVEVVDLRAEALAVLGSVAPFRERLQLDAREIVEWAVAKIDERDQPFFDKAAVLQAVGNRVRHWNRRAEQEFASTWASAASMSRETDEPLPGTEAARPGAQTPRQDVAADSALLAVLAEGRKIVELLDAVVKEQNTTIEDWARAHKIGRTTVFDWKACRLDGRPMGGKVSVQKAAEIEEAIKTDAATLGLIARTDSD
jgi:hypothetical protein